MAKCPVCKEFLTGFQWTKTKTGKNWLADAQGNWHDCPKNVGKYQKNTKWIKLKSEDHQFCNLCGRWLLTEEANKKYPNMNYIDFAWHVKTFHPNGEILDDIDFMVIYNVDNIMTGEKETFEQAMARTRREMRMPKRTKPYKVKGKLVY